MTSTKNFFSSGHLLASEYLPRDLDQKFFFHRGTYSLASTSPVTSTKIFFFIGAPTRWRVPPPMKIITTSSEKKSSKGPRSTTPLLRSKLFAVFAILLLESRAQGLSRDRLLLPIHRGTYSPASTPPVTSTKIFFLSGHLLASEHTTRDLDHRGTYSPASTPPVTSTKNFFSIGAPTRQRVLHP